VELDSIPTNTDDILSDRFLGRRFECACGKEHEVRTRTVVVEPNVTERIPTLMPGLIPGERILLIADRNTWIAAGERLAQALGASHAVECCLLREDPTGYIHASVDLVEELLEAYPDEYDGFVAVGSGTVNDLTRTVADRRDRPYFVLATAASMNGYTSSIVALVEDGLKTTRTATPPVAVFADPAVLVSAPIELTLAGLGDLISKPFCGCDWKIASLVKNEYHCEVPDQLLSVPFARALDVFPWLANQDPEAITELFRLLLVSGLSMAISGTSSPASGAEHLFSHYWDMMRLRAGQPLNLHGAQVGVGSLVVDRLYGEIFDIDFSKVSFVANPNLRKAERDAKEHFGSLAAVVWPQWEAKIASRTERDLERLVAHESLIKGEIEKTLAVGRKVRSALTAAGAPVRADQIGVSPDELDDTIRSCRKIRNRYTALDVAAEVGILEDFSTRFVAESRG
jgi:glycerol-1-phosphate dehydrogenase [NAD(P)+]